MKKIYLKRPVSLSTQVSLYFLMTMLILFIFYGVATYHSNSLVIIEKTREETIRTLNRSSAYLSRYVGDLKNISNVLVSDENINTFMADKTHIEKEKIQQTIETILATDKALVSIFIISRDGRLISNETNLEVSMSDNMMAEEWYQLAIKNKGTPVLTSARKQKLSNKKEDWVISVTQEIMSDKGRNLGIVRIDVGYKGLDSYLKQLDFGKGGSVFLINKTNQIVYHQNMNTFTDQVIQTSIQEENQEKDGYYKKERKLIHHVPVAGTDWQLVGVAYLEELTMVFNNMWQMLGIVSLLVFMIIIIGRLIITQILIKPINQLEEAMKHSAYGLSRAKVEEKGSYEIRSLGASFNTMLTQINQLLIEAEEKERSINEYEINALASQINPHFLYNTLDSIIWMAEFNETEKVIGITKSLADFFRLSLNQGNKMICLEDEIDHVRQYLFIQKQRYEEQLNYRIIEEFKLQDFQVPKLILQPIVENAIYHGIKEINRPGMIHISTHRKTDFVYIKLYDNGKGFDGISTLKKTTTRLGGIGLENVDSRLKLQYGDKYDMRIKSKPNKYTVIIIKLPYN